MKTLLSAIILSISITSLAAQTKEEQEVASTVETLRLAMLNADSAALERLTGEKLTYGHSSGKIEDRKQFLNSLVSGQSDFVTLTFTAQTIAITGKTAIVRHTLTADTNDNGQVGAVKLYVMLVLSKEGSSWKLIARQAVKVLK